MAAELEDVVIFPTGPWLGDVGGQHSNKNPETNRMRGFIGINTKTLLRTFEELSDEIARNGFTKILFLDSHVNFFLKDIPSKEKSYKTYFAAINYDEINFPGPFLKTVTERREDFSMVTDEDIEVMEGWLKVGYQGGHGDVTETAQVMGVRPDLIEPARYEQENGLSIHRTDYLTNLGITIKGDWSFNYPNSYSGAPPHGVTETIGQAMLKICSERIARVYKIIKEDEAIL